MTLISMAESGWMPDALIRVGIRRLLAKRLRVIAGDNGRDRESRQVALLEELRTSRLAVATDQANQQHYEVPAEFFQQVLGPRLKYSGCFFADGATTLAQAEDEMLRQTCERAEVSDGMRVLELGCGWGSLTLWIAEHFPQSQITAVSNSSSQRRFIEARAAERGLSNVQVVTADMRDFTTDRRFDRVVSVEMFEHMRNYELLLHRISNWLTPEGKVFVHIFCHRDTPYLFETEGAANWMGRHFFTGGIMPSEDLLGHFNKHLQIHRQWNVNGKHYWRTCEAWLSNLDKNRESLLASFQRDLTADQARRTLQRWRMFFMACAELFRYRDGNEWFVAHYLMHPTSASTPEPQLAASHEQ